MPYHRYRDLLENNRRWAEAMTRDEPDYFQRLAQGQQPPFLFIGCCDSRKPLNNITQSHPGELFIHRNIGNQVRPTDPNVRAVLEFAIGVLKVEHVIVCGHTRCGGVGAALRGDATGAVEAWVAPIRELHTRNAEAVEAAGAETARIDRLAELNVVAQVENVLRTSTMQDAMGGGHTPRLHGWMFRVETGLVEELDLPLDRWRDEGLLPKGD